MEALDERCWGRGEEYFHMGVSVDLAKLCSRTYSSSALRAHLGVRFRTLDNNQNWDAIIEQRRQELSHISRVFLVFFAGEVILSGLIRVCGVRCVGTWLGVKLITNSYKIHL